MKKTFYSELKTDKHFYARPFNYTIIGISIGYIFYDSDLFPSVNLIGLSIAVLLILIGLVLLTEKVILSLVGFNLVVKKSYLGIPLTKHYDLRKIKELKFDKKVKSNQFRRKGEVRVMGMDMTPEKMKKYYFHPEILSFVYETNKIKIGRFKKPFEGKKLYNLIKEKTN